MSAIKPIIERHANGAITLTFPPSDQTFASSIAAERFLEERGFSVGRRQGPDPRGVIFGDFDVQKWRNLSALDREALDGQMTGNGRTTPVMVSIYSTARDEAKDAILKGRPARSASDRAVDVAGLAAVALTLAFVVGSIGYVGLHPIFARHSTSVGAAVDASKLTMRAGPLGLRNAVAEARR